MIKLIEYVCIKGASESGGWLEHTQYCVQGTWNEKAWLDLNSYDV